MEKLLIATRSSPLAMWQAEYVAGLLRMAGFDSCLIPLETSGDRKLEVSLSKIGDKGLFTQELESLLLNGEAHLAVHSAKDMPSNLPGGLEIIAFTERENPADVVVSLHPDLQLSQKDVRIGTSSTRRTAMLARSFSGVQTVSVRGNLQTRFRKMQEGECDGMILAAAGVSRMGLGSFIREQLSTDIFTPAAGQGSLAIEAAVHLPAAVRSAIRLTLNHPLTEMAVACERSFLRELEGGCSIPVFAFCSLESNGIFNLQGGIISLNGSQEVRKSIKIESLGMPAIAEFENAGKRLAGDVLASGGSAILQKIRTEFS